MKDFIIGCAVTFLLSSAVAPAKAEESVTLTGVGVHTGSWHGTKYDSIAGREWNNVNPGVYGIYKVKSEWVPDGTYVVGTYFNSIRKQSLYVGYVYPLFDNVDVVLGVISGYNGVGATGKKYPAMAVMPMVVPSIHFPIASGIRGRIHVIPKLDKVTPSVVHFSLEFKM